MRLLIVGTLNGQLAAATRITMERGAKVVHADTVDIALRTLRSGKGADLILADVHVDIGSFLQALENERFHVPLVACGVETDADAAVRAIKAGAKEYIPLPPDPVMIAAVLAAVVEEKTDIVVQDPAMKQVLKLADQIAPSDASVLITGESGTGKEVMARYVHQHSNRRSLPFISVNCAAIPENLLESELFGHEKGAFTGAIARRIGKFEEASGGTLLLDEISEMDVRLQAKLLRALQERVIDRVGGQKPIKVDIRIIATSNRNLSDAVQEKTFREDLFYRLNVVNLKLPALRERPQDIVALSEHFVQKYSKANHLDLKSLSTQTLETLRANVWRGNVRELENTLHRAVLLARGDQIEPHDIMAPDGSQTTLSSSDNVVVDAAKQAADFVTRDLVGRTVSDVEKDLILDTLDHCLGNRTHASNILGISIRTLRNKLNQYQAEGVSVPVPGQVRGV